MCALDIGHMFNKYFKTDTFLMGKNINLQVNSTSKMYPA